jgi:hypothetical protein
LHLPKCVKISIWVVAPYKKPERDLPDNEFYNNHLSMVRIRSEHAIGFLKGRFASLKNLRVHIKNEKSHKFATYWIASCVGIHAFAMHCEAEENPNEDVMQDPFINEGLSSSSSSDNVAPARSRRSSARLQAAKAHCEKLKRRLMRAKRRES